jgi:hypothetical protein
VGWIGISGLMLLAAAQAAPPAAPAPRVGPPDPRVQFTGGAAPVFFDNKCRNFTVATLPGNPSCADRVARGETAASIEVALATFLAARTPAEAAPGLAVMEKAIAAENHPAAHYFLASVLATSERLPPDYPRAVRHLEAAVAGGNVAAADLLATLVLEGRGTRQDVARAVSLYERAMAGGMSASASRLALLYVQGNLVAKDDARARTILQAAAAAGDPQAPVTLMMLDTKVTAYQMHPRPDGDPELRVYGGLDTPFIPPGFGFTDEFRKLHNTAYSDPAVLERLEREQASLPTPYLYELARRYAAVSAEKALGYYMLGRLRMTYDAKRCADPMAMEGVSAWDRIVARDLRFLLVGAAAAERRAAVDFALAREATMPADSRPWWVCYSGMEAYGLAMEKKPVPLKLKPAKDWPRLRGDARDALKALLTAPPTP